MEFNVLKVVQTAIAVGVIGDSDTDRLIKLIDLLEDVRQEALNECFGLCSKVADKHHTSMWENRAAGLKIHADMDKSRVEAAELIQRMIRKRMNYESQPGTQGQGRDTHTAAAIAGSTAPQAGVGGAPQGAPASIFQVEDHPVDEERHD